MAAGTGKEGVIILAALCLTYGVPHAPSILSKVCPLPRPPQNASYVVGHVFLNYHGLREKNGVLHRSV